MLANAAEHRNDWDNAVEWWQTRAAQDPFDSRVTIRLMQAFEAAGNPAAALQHATIHTTLLYHELSLDAPADVIALANAIRERVRTTNAEPASPLVASCAAKLADNASSAAVRSVPFDDIEVPAHRTRRRTLQYVVAAVVLAAAIVATIQLRNGRSAAASLTNEPSIAVLPLTNLGNDARDRALADGLTEELIAALSKNGKLRVIGSTSVFSFRESKMDVRHIADSLHVSNVLEGGFQKIGSRVRVQIRLVDARDGSTRWSSTFDRELQDVFAVQDEIARSVTRELGLQLATPGGPRLRPPTSNVAAYELFLRGNDPALLRSDSTARMGLEYFKQAVALDPSYAAAHAGVARLTLRSRAGTSAARRRELLKLAEASALRAVSLDSLSADAHAALGLVKRTAYDYATAERLLLRAAELNPTDSRIDEWLVQLYVWLRRPQDAVLHAQAAVANDPLSPTARAELARALQANDRCDEALGELERLTALQPPMLRAKAIAAHCYAQKQMWPQAIAEMRGLQKNGGLRAQGYLAYLLAKSGRAGEARRIHNSLLERWRAGTGEAFPLAITYASLGDLDHAFLWLNRSIEDLTLGYEVPLPTELHADPRFQSLINKARAQNR
jgi:adenylate cyclase